MRGIWTALVTPFTSDNELDLPAFKKILHDQKNAGVAGVIPCGTTGESPTLSNEEKKTLIQTAINELRGSQTRVYAGTGSNDTDEAVELSRWASEAGADGVLVVTPYYNKPTQAGLEAHYRKIADALSPNCDLMLYNVPGRTGVSLTPETVAKLAEHPRIRSLKEATGNTVFTSDVFDALATRGGAKLDVFSGDDGIFLPMLSVGAAGVVSVASNLFPRGMKAIQESFEKGDHEQATKYHRHFYPLFRDLFVESNPGPIKAAMAYAGWCDERVRLPLAPITAESRKKLAASLTRCGVERGRQM